MTTGLAVFSLCLQTLPEAEPSVVLDSKTIGFMGAP